MLDDSSGESNDGYLFTRTMSPEQVALSGEYEGKFDIDKSIAYEFDVPKATRIYARSAPGFWTALEGSFADFDFFSADEHYQTSVLLFRVDERADPASPMDRYDYVTKANATRNNGWTGALEYDVQSPGRYMIAIAGNDACFDDELEIATQLEELAPVEQRSPGDVDIRAMTADGDFAAGMRVAIGTAEAITNDQGLAILEDVEPGLQTIRFGQQGLGRVEGCETFTVIGNGKTQPELCRIPPSDYESWIAE